MFAASSVTNPEVKSVQLQQILDQVDQDGRVHINGQVHEDGQVGRHGRADEAGHSEKDSAVSSHDRVARTASSENKNAATHAFPDTSGSVRADSKSLSKIPVSSKSNDENQAPSSTQQISSNSKSKLSTTVKPPISNRKSVSFAEGTKEEPERPTALRPNSRTKGGLPLKHQAILDQLKRAVMPLGEEPEDVRDRTQAESVCERIADVLQNAKSPIRSAQGEQRSKAEKFQNYPKPEIASEPNESSEASSELQMSNARIPTNESPEHASLRSQMLNYNMNQVGSIVAEIDLDDAHSERSWSNSEDDDDDDDSASHDAISTPDEDEDEDEHGRARRKMLSEQYIKEMEALQKRLGAVPIVNVGPNQPDTKDLSAILGAEAAVVDNAELTGTALAGPQLTPKRAPYSSKPDIQAARVAQAPSKPSDTGKKISRFKQARATNSSALTLPPQASVARPEDMKTSLPDDDFIERKFPPTNPSNTTPLKAPAKRSPIRPTTTTSDKAHGDVFERRAPPSFPPATTPSTHPGHETSEEDDPSFIAKQLNEEYHRLRNRMIYRQGGFLQSEEEKEEEEDLYERKDGSGKKVSRFMAARLGK